MVDWLNENFNPAARMRIEDICTQRDNKKKKNKKKKKKKTHRISGGKRTLVKWTLINCNTARFKSVTNVRTDHLPPQLSRAGWNRELKERRGKIIKLHHPSPIPTDCPCIRVASQVDRGFLHGHHQPSFFFFLFSLSLFFASPFQSVTRRKIESW